MFWKLVSRQTGIYWYVLCLTYIWIGGQGTMIQSIKSAQREGFVHVIGAVAEGNPKESINDLATMLLMGQVSVRRLWPSFKPQSNR